MKSLSLMESCKMTNELEIFRADLIRDVNDCAEEANAHPVNSFIERILQRLGNDLGVTSTLDYCYVNRPRQGKFKRMRLDAGAYDPTTFEVALVLADFDEGPCQTIGREDILDCVKCLVNFYTNALDGVYPPQASGPEAELANAIKRNQTIINRLHLYIFTTHQLSNRLKEFTLPVCNFNGVEIKVKLDVVDIERLYNSIQGPEEFTIMVKDFNCPPIPCVKAEIETDAYDTYLAIVPAQFLSEIYKEYGGKLLRANVRAFLNMRGDVNKGIRDSIRNEPDKFFAYNNGIATTATSVELEQTESGLRIASFTGLQIINGGQTTASLALVSIKEKLPLTNIFVQMKLTIVKNGDREFIRNIAKYANRQTKVTTTDLNSSHDYYITLETLSRRLYAPVAPGAVKPTKWFFERVKNQYEQPALQMTKSEQKRYSQLFPKTQKFGIQDVARVVFSFEKRPFAVALGGEVNARFFHNWIEEKWNQDPLQFNEAYYKKLVGMIILYARVKKVVQNAQWYKEKKGNLGQIVAYTYSKFVLVIEEAGFEIDLIKIWNSQEVPQEINENILSIAKEIFDYFYNPNAPFTDVREHCKCEICWENISSIQSKLMEETLCIFKD